MRDYEPELSGRQAPRPRHDAIGPATSARTPDLGRAAALDAATVLHLQRTAGNAGVVQMLAAGGEERAETASPIHQVVGSGGGSPLDARTRATMEAALGASFEHVRVHTDDRASESARSVGANAYTVGSDVVFRRGQYDPGSSSGQRTLAHELAHVVQQSQGPVDGVAAPGGIRVSDPSDRFERSAEQTADQVMSAVHASPAQPAASPASAPVAQLEENGAAATVQRVSAVDDEEEATAS